MWSFSLLVVKWRVMSYLDSFGISWLPVTPATTAINDIPALTIRQCPRLNNAGGWSRKTFAFCKRIPREIGG